MYFSNILQVKNIVDTNLRFFMTQKIEFDALLQESNVLNIVIMCDLINNLNRI